MSGYASTLGGAVISRKPSKQSCITKSMMKSKLIALDKVVEEAEWIHNFLKGIPYWPKLVPNLYVHCDSQSIIEGYKVICIMISLDIYVINIILLNTCSRIKLLSLTM